MVLYRPDGNQMTAEDWQNPAARTLAVALDGRQITDTDGDATSDRFLLLLNAHHEPVEFALPISTATWRAVLTTGGPDDTPAITPRGTITLVARALLLLHSSAPTLSAPRQIVTAKRRAGKTVSGRAAR
jgi:isoamylase